jgi:hypothetical protein
VLLFLQSQAEKDDKKDLATSMPLAGILLMLQLALMADLLLVQPTLLILTSPTALVAAQLGQMASPLLRQRQ